MAEKADKTRKMFSLGTQSDHLTLYEAFRVSINNFMEHFSRVVNYLY